MLFSSEQEVKQDLCMIKEVDAVNMLDLFHVILALKQYGFTSSAVYLEENPHLYRELLEDINKH